MMSIKAECSALLAVLLASTTCYAAQPKIPPLNATPATTPAAIQAVRMHQADVELKQAQDACRHQPDRKSVV